MKTRVHVIPHMHWDREWYFTTEESRILLVNNMKEIMDRLESDPDYPSYLLDGQTCILEDYFAVCPENFERFRTLVQSGRLIIGPWYTQTDSIVVGGESIIRNLFYGMKDCKALGPSMKIGYLPDSFGQSSQLPQIFQGFGFSRAVFWRGTSERLGTNKTEFIWEGPAGTRVTTQILPLGYAIGKYLPLDEEALKKRLASYMEVLKNGMTGHSVILPHGHDQMPLQKNIHQVVEKLNGIFPDCEFFLSSYDRVFEEIPLDKLDTINGELNDGKYMRVHRSISSTRMDIKVLNTRLENRITNILEPLMSIASSLGFDYHHGLVEHIWKLIMKNHAHDSIGCCCSDEVHREIKERFLLAEDKINKLIEFYKRKIADHCPQREGADQLVIYNFLAEKRCEIVDARVRIRASGFKLTDSQGKNIPYTVVAQSELDPGIIDRQIVHYGTYDPFIDYHIRFQMPLSPMGYEACYIEKIDQPSKTGPVQISSCLENEYYRITVNANGTLNVFSKALNREFNGLLALESGSDDGDEYDYSPLAEDFILHSNDCEAQSRCSHLGGVSKAEIDFRWKLPKNLEERRIKIRSTDVDFHLEVCLKEGDPLIYAKVSFNSPLEDHRLRVLLPTPYESKQSFADRQFGLITRPVYDSALDIWQEEEWSEKPVNIYSMMSLVGLRGSGQGLAAFTDGIREYEIIGARFDTIALTLMRGVGVLGKSDLFFRPGRPSGISLPTPDSQMKGAQSYKFAFTIFQGSEEQCPILAKRYTTPVETYNKIPFNAMKLNLEDIKTPGKFSLLSLGGGACLSTLKQAEDGTGLIMRIYNPSLTKPAEARIESSFKKTSLADFAEVELTPMDDSSIKNISPCQVLSIKISD